MYCTKINTSFSENLLVEDYSYFHVVQRKTPKFNLIHGEGKTLHLCLI